MARFWIIVVFVTLVLFGLVFVGAASILNARLLGKSSFLERRENANTESTVVVHVHDVHVERPFLFGRFHGFSSKQSYFLAGILRVPVSNDKWNG